ncbi:hypothetical protein [Pseudolysinimonas sp.]|uniref:hypothetical protein n=1 Tax=Pseudolysinimonas sp. TaxID=2680009 RepID=UPI003F7D3787
MVDWGAFLLVAAVSIGATALIVSLFATGLRLLAVTSPRGLALAGASACFTVAGAAVLFGVWLLIPAFHA